MKQENDALQILLIERQRNDRREFIRGFATGAAVIAAICTTLAMLGVHAI